MDKSLFWQFNTASNPKYSTIYGTIHLGSDECMRHWGRVEKIIATYNRVFTESSLAQEDMRYLQPFTLLEKNTHIEDYVTPNRWSRMRKTFKKYGHLDINDYRMIRPLFIAAQVQSALIGASEQEALDHLIWNRALATDKSVAGIESAQEQVAILLSLDLRQQYQNLIRMSRHISGTKRKIKKLLHLYAREDITSLYKMSKASLGRDRSALIGQRNHIIARRLIDHHNRESAFFTFGAGHLGGGQGIVHLLKKSGAIVRSAR